MSKKIIISIDASFTNTGVSVYHNGEYHFREFTSMKNKIGKKGQELKTQEKDIFTFWSNLKKIEQEFVNDKGINKEDVLVCYNTMFSHNQTVLGVLYKLIGVLELAFNDYDIKVFKENVIRKELIGSVKRNGRTQKEANKEESIKFFKEKNGYEVTDDIADSFMLCYYVTEKGDL